MCKLALWAIQTISLDECGIKSADIRRYACVEGNHGEQGCYVSHVRHRIANPRIVLLDCPLEHKKGAPHIKIEILKEADWELEEEQLKVVVDNIPALEFDLVMAEKSISGKSP